MKTTAVILSAIALSTSLIVSAACTCTPNDPLGGKIYTASPATDEGEKQSGAFTIPNPTSTGQQGSTAAQSRVQETERKITVTKSNTEFTIGLPAGYTEEREITASRLVDIWFKYITPDMSLVVNGEQVQIPERRTMSKMALTQGVTHLTYKLKNLSSSYLSYSLMIVPVNAAEQVPVVTKEKWTAP